MERPQLIRPGMFGVAAAADDRRHIFDLHNEALLARRAPVDAVFIGDSITEMWALDVYFEGSSGHVVNRGISGDRTPFVRRRFEADVLQLRPRLVVLKIGVNNTEDLDYPWDPDVYRPPESIEEEIVADIEAMVTAARVESIAVALCSILPMNRPTNANTAMRNAVIARANTRLRLIAADHGALFVDYHARMVEEDGLTLRPELADDGLHPHVVGYEIMAEVLLGTLSAAGIDSIRDKPFPGR